MKLQNVAYSLIITSLVVLLLIFAEPILVPFVIAMLIWFVVKKTRNLIDKARFAEKYIPTWIKTLVASLFIFSLILSIGRLLVYNIEQLSTSYTTYSSNATLIAERIHKLMGIDLNAEITHFIENFDLSSFLKSFINSISSVLGNMMMIVFYTIFLFIEEALFLHKVHLIFTNSSVEKSYKVTLRKIDKTMSRYIALKSLIALLTASLGYIVFLIVGLDAPLFWAFLLFMLNFIPSVGPIFASVLPALFSLLQFGEFGPFLIILCCMTAIAVLIGNFIEPKLMGNTLNISPLVAVLSLAVWGALWGITGMLLSVPITVALIIIFSQFPSTRGIAILLSERGRV